MTRKQLNLKLYQNKIQPMTQSLPKYTSPPFPHKPSNPDTNYPTGPRDLSPGQSIDNFQCIAHRDSLMDRSVLLAQWGNTLTHESTDVADAGDLNVMQWHIKSKIGADVPCTDTVLSQKNPLPMRGHQAKFHSSILNEGSIQRWHVHIGLWMDTRTFSEKLLYHTLAR